MILLFKSCTNWKVLKFFSYLIAIAQLVVLVSGNFRLTLAATPTQVSNFANSSTILSQANSHLSDERQIKAAVTEDLEKVAGPRVVPKIEKVYIVQNYAVANWILGQSGGQAVVRKQQEHWKLLTSGGGAINASYLHILGVPEKQAQELMDLIDKHQ